MENSVNPDRAWKDFVQNNKWEMVYLDLPLVAVN